MTKTAIYAGSFDPFTNGHRWVAEQAAELFDRLVIAVGENPAKTTTFSLDERVELIKRSTADLFGIEVVSFPFQYLARYAGSRKIEFIVRGIRSSDDFEMESNMVAFNREIEPGVRTVFLIPPPELRRVSSSAVKLLIGPTGWEKMVKKYVSEPVLAVLVKKYRE